MILWFRSRRNREWPVLHYRGLRDYFQQIFSQFPSIFCTPSDLSISSGHAEESSDYKEFIFGNGISVIRGSWVYNSGGWTAKVTSADLSFWLNISSSRATSLRCSRVTLEKGKNLKNDCWSHTFLKRAENNIPRIFQTFSLLENTFKKQTIKRINYAAFLCKVSKNCSETFVLQRGLLKSVKMQKRPTSWCKFDFNYRISIYDSPCIWIFQYFWQKFPGTS